MNPESLVEKVMVCGDVCRLYDEKVMVCGDVCRLCDEF